MNSQEVGLRESPPGGNTSATLVAGIETSRQTDPAEERIVNPFGHVLVPLDGSDLAEKVLPYAEQLGKASGSRVTLLRAISPFELDYMHGLTRLEAAGEMSESAQDLHFNPSKYLATVENQLVEKGIQVTSECLEEEQSDHIRPGHVVVADAIIRRARELNVDLIAMTTHGWSGLKLMMHGSVADQVVRNAPCPVLLVTVHESYNSGSYELPGRVSPAVLHVVGLARRMGGGTVAGRARRIGRRNSRRGLGDAPTGMQHLR